MNMKFKNNCHNLNSFRVSQIDNITEKKGNDNWLQCGIQVHALGDYSFRSASTTNTCVGFSDNYTTSQGAFVPLIGLHLSKCVHRQFHLCLVGTAP